MNIRTLRGRLVASVIAFSLVTPAAMAKSADTLQDLVGARAGQAENTLVERGWVSTGGGQGNGEAWVFWWNASRKDCARITTRDGRYAAIEDAKADDCGHKSSGDGAVAAAAVIGAVAIGALLLTRKSKKDRPADESGYQPDWQQVEVHDVQSGSLKIFNRPDKSSRVVGSVGAGTVLRNYGCEDGSSEVWCEVATTDGRTSGWARDRYLRVTHTGYQGGGSGQGSGYSPPYGSGSSGSGMLVEAYGLQSGMLRIMSTPSTSGYEIAAVGTGTQLRRFGCRTEGGESWCEVHTIDGGVRGWARERYLRQSGTSGQGSGYSVPYNYGGSGSGTRVEAYGLQSGMLRIMSTPSTSGYEIAAVATGTRLLRFGCQTINSESWCEIHTIDGGVRGWARERYLRPY